MEPLQGRAVKGTALALVVRRMGSADVGTLLPRKPQPAQIGEHGLREVYPVARRVQVLASQDERAAAVAGAPLRNPERAGVPEVKVSGRGGGEAPPVRLRGDQGFGFIFGRRAPSSHLLTPWQSSCASTAVPQRI